MRTKSKMWTWVLAALTVAGLVAIVGVAGYHSVLEAAVPGGLFTPEITKAHTTAQAKMLRGETLTPDEKRLITELNAIENARNPRNHLDNQGGPDAFGYTYVDNVSPDTATYNWIELCGDANATNGPTGDDITAPATIGFSFPFYGTNYTSCYISTNGLISFVAADGTFDASDPEASSPVNPYIAPMWVDWNTAQSPSGGCNADAVGPWIRYETFGTAPNQYWVLEYRRMPEFAEATLCTFEAILYSSGRIKVQFHNTEFNMPVDSTGRSFATGIDAPGAYGVRYWYHGYSPMQTLGNPPAAGRVVWFSLPNGLPNPVTNLQGNATGTSVTLTWVDPNHDTNGNPQTPDSIDLYRGDTQPASQIGHVAHGVQTFTAASQPSGNQTYYARAKAGTWMSSPASVTVAIGSPTYNNNFDSDNGNLTPIPDTGGWTWGPPTNAGGPQPHSSPNVWAIGLNADYAVTQCDDLDIDLGLDVNSANAYVEFWAWYYVETGFDGVNFRASTDGGTTWQILHPSDRRYDVATYTGTSNCISGDSAWSGNSNGWVHIAIPIGQFNGQTPMFRLKFGSDASVNYRGFYIDDMTIWGLQTPQGANVSGHVTLDGLGGDVTQVLVTSDGLGSPNTHPAANGNYTLTSCQVGNRLIRATLANFVDDTLHITLGAGGYTNANMTLRRVPPPAPTNLTGTILTAQRKDSLHWDVSPDVQVDGYQVYRRMRGDTTWTARERVVGRTLNWVKDSLNLDGVYQFVVAAFDSNVTNPPIYSAHSNMIEQPFGHLPAQMLSVDGQFDNKYHLSWIAPGVVPEVELFYDDSTDEGGGIGFNSAFPNAWFATHFHTTSGAATITRLKMLFTSIATPGNAIQIGVFADDGAGHPTTTPLGLMTVNQTAPFGVFVEYTLTSPVTIPSGSFFVGLRQMTATRVEIGGDNTTPYINNTFFYTTDLVTWATWESIPLLYIPMLRCYASGNFGGLAEELSPTPVGDATPASAFSTALETKTVRALKGSATGSVASLSNRSSKLEALAAMPTSANAMSPWLQTQRRLTSVAPHAPHFLAAGNNARGRNSLDDVTRYLIYQDNALHDSVAGTITQYDDVLGSNHENENHNFFVRARWDDNALSPSTDTLRNQRFNMAPGAPGNVSSTSVGQTQMRITWADPTLNADGTPCVDLAGLNVYRNATLLTTTPVAPGVQQYLDTPPFPDSVYTWTVKAVDEVPNEGPGGSTSGAIISPWRTVPYNWVDISTVGTNTGLNSDDQTLGPFDLGFTFTYYGQDFTSIYACTNGFTSFNSGTLATYLNATLPGAGNPTCALYPFWDDLIMTSSGHCYYYHDVAGNRFILEWLDVPQFSGGAAVTFEIILDATGGVTFQYMTTANDASATIGVENCDHTDAIQLCYNGAGLWCPTDGSAVQFWGGPHQAISGVVRHYNGTTNPTLANAAVWVEGQADTVRTDATGNYNIPIAPGTYTVHYTHAQHCDSVRTNVTVDPGVPTTINLALRSPAGSVSATSLTFIVHQNTTMDQQFTIQNANSATGTCPMHYQVIDSVAWLSSSPSSGDLNPGQTATITVTAAPGNMNPAELQTRLWVVARTPGSPFQINVDMTVLNVRELGGALPTVFALRQNYPNPFNPTTLLPFDVPQTSQVDIVVYNVMGQEVARPVSGKYSAGRYEVNFAAGNLPSGVYLVKMTAGNFHALSKMMLLK